MTCASCASRLESALNRVPGVMSASVNLALDVADVRFNSATATEADLIRAVSDAGFTANKIVTAASEGRAVLVAAMLTAPLVMAMIAHSVGAALHLPPWLELALATPVQFYLGARFYRGAAAAIRHGGANMDVLIVLGTTTAFALSAARVIIGDGALYFESSAVIITLVLFGKWLEARAKRSATSAIEALMQLRPATARVLRGAAEEEVPISTVVVGDTVVIKPGEKIPVDGRIVAGETECDEAMISGESVPLHRAMGDVVTGGALNGDGMIHVRVTAVGADATLAKISRIVEQAQAGKAPIQKLVDRVSAVFVPLVILAAMAVFAGWLWQTGDVDRAVNAMISVLVIACPCALGLATPAALVAGTGAAARAGILIKNIDALERLHAVDTVVLDKTGTLTRGRPEIVDFRLSAAAPPDTLSLLASAESASEHIYARAVVALANDRGVQFVAPDSLKMFPGRGVRARVSGHDVVIGNARHFADLHLTVDQCLTANDTVATQLFAAISGTHVATLSVSDQVRAESSAAVAALRALHLKPVILSGDQPGAVAAVAAALGIQDAEGSLRPEDKAKRITHLRNAGAKVAMVGDGINDTPALAAADVGIAIGGATDVAMETADVTLLRPDPRLIAAAIDISRATWRKIQQNLFWAMIYNVVAIPFAALGALTPALAGAAMAASSVSVVVNALALSAWRAPK